jgi:hypothetical protein
MCPNFCMAKLAYPSAQAKSLSSGLGAGFDGIQPTIDWNGEAGKRLEYE